MQLIPSTNVTFFLANTTDPSNATLDRVDTELREGPGSADALQFDTRATALDKDQSSLAALNIRGLLTLDSAYALAMAATAITIFVFGLLLQRRREYVTLRAQGMRIGRFDRSWSPNRLVLWSSERWSGSSLGAITAYVLVNVLQPLFVLRPELVIAASRHSVYSPGWCWPSRWLRRWQPPPSFVVYLPGSCCGMSNQSDATP